MITIILRGTLGKEIAHPKTGNSWRLAASSPAEACHAINVLTDGRFVRFLIEAEKDMQGYHVQVDDQTIGENMLLCSCDERTVTITPILQGADTKGVLQIVAGVALIAVGVAFAGYLGPFAAPLVGLGLGVALGGVARLLMGHTPPATLATQDKTQSSYVFTGAINTIQQGECVPVQYGECIAGSGVVSASVEAYDIQA
jgi:predicted phage tail protein